MPVNRLRNIYVHPKILYTSNLMADGLTLLVSPVCSTYITTIIPGYVRWFLADVFQGLLHTMSVESWYSLEGVGCAVLPVGITLVLVSVYS